MRRPPRWLLLFALLTLTPDTTEARNDGLADEVLLTPRIGEYLWLVEAYMATAWFGRYFETGALTTRDFFGGFVDVDRDGVDELLILVDHKIACEDRICDLFIFETDGEPANLRSPCNWNLAERTKTETERSLYERFALAGQRIIVLERLPLEFLGQLKGLDWFDYFASVYDMPVEWDEILLGDVRVGTYDVNGDGRDEVFIYIVSPAICGRDECGGAILEVIPHADGSQPGWRWIGELNSLDPALDTVAQYEGYDTPRRAIRVLDSAVDGYATLCTRDNQLRWNGEAYEIDFGQGCPD